MSKYKTPSLTADIFIFDDDFNFILIKRLNDPYKNCWALPGGFVEYGEKVEHAVIREAKEETGLDIELNKLVGVYSDANRDPRGHTVSVVYMASIVGGQLKSDTDAKDVQYFEISELNKMDLAFDHKQILNDSGILG